MGKDGAAPLSASSAARCTVAVRGWHKFALLEGEVGEDVAREVRPPSQPKRLPKAISIADVQKLLDAAGIADNHFGLRDRAILELLYGTGARIRSEEHTSELQSRGHLVCRLLLEKKKSNSI